MRHLAQFTLSALLLALGIGAAWAIVAGRPEPQEQELPRPRPVSVATLTLQPRDVDRPVTVTGTLRAGREASLAPQAAGLVVQVAEGLREGAPIEAGALLLQLDPRPTDLELATQRSTVRLQGIRLEAARESLLSAGRTVSLAERQLGLLVQDEDRWRSLVEDGKAERARLDAASRGRLGGEAALEESRQAERGARAAVDAAEQEIRVTEARIATLVDRRERLTLRAPFGGVFALPPGGRGGAPEVGDVLGVGTPVGLLLDLSTFELECGVHIDDAVALEPGARVVVAPLARPGRLLEGKVTHIGARVEPRLRTVQVHGRVAAPADARGWIADGAFCHAELQGRALRDVLHLDESSVAFRGGEPVAFIAEADAEGVLRARKRRLLLRPGIVDGGRVVLGGLEAGEELITGPLELVGEGIELKRAAAPAGEGR